MLTLTSCDFVIADTESLLAPPIINKQQQEITSALEATLNLDDIIYRYPQGGEYRSPFVFYDMDGDGIKEFIFFYSFVSDPTSTRAEILRQRGENQWESIHSLSETSDQINFVRFAHLLDAESACMIIGWRSTMGQKSLLEEDFIGVHSLSKDGVFTNEIVMQPYIGYLVQDFDGDGLEEIITVERERSQTMYCTLLRAVAGHLNGAARLPLNSQTDVLLNLTSGLLWDNTRALYVDEIRSDGTTGTEIIRVTAGGFTLLAGGEQSTEDEFSPWDNYTYTWRDSPVISRDYDGDGRVEVPELTALPGIQEEDKEALPLVRLLQFNAEGFNYDEGLNSIVINEEDGYFVYYPENWLDRVGVERNDENHEWKFSLLDLDTDKPAIELLRITTYSGDSALGPGEIELGRVGTRRYAGYIPTPAPDVPSSDEAQLKSMFVLLPS